ncbi:MAG: kelch repeat-containing protein [Myxococcota bacterium]
MRAVAEDEIGQAIDVLIGQVTVDRIAPTLLGLSRSPVAPGSASVLTASVDVLGPTATVELAFEVTEPLASIEFVANPSGSLTAAALETSPTEYRVQVAGANSGSNTLAIRVTDAAGNSRLCDPAAGCETASLTFAADLETPAPPPVDVAGAVTLIRRPNGGRSATVAGTRGDAFASTLLQLFSRDTLPLGEISTDANGTFTLDLPVSDIRDVFVRVVNAAGTPSSQVKILDGEWHGEFSDKRAGDASTNRNRVTTADFDEPVLTPDNLVELDDAAYVELRGAGAMHSAAIRWENVASRTVAEVARSARAATYEPESGSVYIFGGYDGAVTLGGLIRFNGRGYSQVETSGEVPSPRDGATLTSLPDRRQLLLVGGLPNDSAPPSAEAWLFDLESSTWSRVADIPTGRWLHAAVYDPIRGRVAVVGGCRGPLCNGSAANGELFPDPDNPAGILSDTVFWDPASNSWTDSGFVFGDADPNFRGRFGHGLLFDSSRDVLLAVGGINGIQLPASLTTARWNGREYNLDGQVFELTETGWNALESATNSIVPSFRSALYYDASADRVYSFGGMRTGSGGAPSEGTLWVWDRVNSWTLVPTTVAIERSDAFLYRDPRTESLTVVNGMRWDRSARSRFVATLAIFEVEAASDAWALDETNSPATWSPVGVAAVPGQEFPVTTRPGIAYDENRRRVVIYGGYEFLDAPYQTVREWTGAQWRLLEIDPVGQPSPRTEFPFFFDPSSIIARVASP